jgi:hypothetical protein
MEIISDDPQNFNEVYRPTVDVTEFTHDNQIKFNDVLSDLMLATHCHGCGVNMKVCLYGYCGIFCSKSCWKFIQRDYDEYQCDCGKDNCTGLCNYKYECPFKKYKNYECKYCKFGTDKHRVSFARSKYHHEWNTSQSPTGIYYPMGNARLCNNQCIKERKPINLYK